MVGNMANNFTGMMWNNSYTSAMSSIHDKYSYSEKSDCNCTKEPPQIYNFIKENECRQGHMSVPPLLNANGTGKVYVDIGLDAGEEFFAALSAGYSVYGFEANPLSAMNLKTKCEKEITNCKFVNGSDIETHLPPIHRGGYLIFGGVGSTKMTMNMSMSGAGSSFAEKPPTTAIANLREQEVNIFPLSDVVNVDVFLMKIDVQGFEFEVLKGAKALFKEKVVKTLLMEVYPRGLGNAGVDFLDFLSFLWDDLGLMCSSSLPPSSKGAFKVNHPNSLPEFAEYIKGISDGARNIPWWGAFDDFYCFNRRKLWKWD